MCCLNYILSSTNIGKSQCSYDSKAKTKVSFWPLFCKTADMFSPDIDRVSFDQTHWEIWPCMHAWDQRSSPHGMANTATAKPKCIIMIQIQRLMRQLWIKGVCLCNRCGANPTEEEEEKLRYECKALDRSMTWNLKMYTKSWCELHLSCLFPYQTKITHDFNILEIYTTNRMLKYAIWTIWFILFIKEPQIMFWCLSHIIVAFHWWRRTYSKKHKLKMAFFWVFLNLNHCQPGEDRKMLVEKEFICNVETTIS